MMLKWWEKKWVNKHSQISTSHIVWLLNAFKAHHRFYWHSIYWRVLFFFHSLCFGMAHFNFNHIEFIIVTCTSIENSLCVHRLTLINLSSTNSKSSIPTNTRMNQKEKKKRERDKKYYFCTHFDAFYVRNFNFKCLVNIKFFSFCPVAVCVCEKCVWILYMCANGFYILLSFHVYSIHLHHIFDVNTCAWMAQLNLL